MSFRFPLQTLLHFRQSMEHQQETRLRVANQRVSRVRHMIEQQDQLIRALQIQGENNLRSGTTSAEIRFQLLSQSAATQQKQSLERELLRLERERDEQQASFQLARRERETVEGLRDRQLHEFQRASSRREQRNIDDLYLLRQAYLRRTRG